MKPPPEQPAPDWLVHRAFGGLDWASQKHNVIVVDPHGKVVANWIVSSIIYFAVSVLLIFVLIGIPLVLLLCFVGVIFPIIGGIKASDGQVWKYPLSITFFR